MLNCINQLLLYLIPFVNDPSLVPHIWISYICPSVYIFCCAIVLFFIIIIIIFADSILTQSFIGRQIVVMIILYLKMILKIELEKENTQLREYQHLCTT